MDHKGSSWMSGEQLQWHSQSFQQVGIFFLEQQVGHSPFSRSSGSICVCNHVDNHCQTGDLRNVCQDSLGFVISPA